MNRHDAEGAEQWLYSRVNLVLDTRQTLGISNHLKSRIDLAEMRGRGVKLRELTMDAMS